MKALVNTDKKIIFESENDHTIRELIELSMKKTPDLFDLNLCGVDLKGLHLRNGYIVRVDFSEANLEGCFFENTYFRDCKFDNSNLREARIVDCDFYGELFRKTILTNAILVRNNFKRGSFHEANTEDMYVKECCFREATLSSCDLRNIDFEDCDLKRAGLYSSLVSGAIIKESDFLTIKNLHKKEEITHKGSPTIIYDVSGEGSLPIYCAYYFLRKGKLDRTLKREYFTSIQKVESFAKFYGMEIVEKNSRKSLSKLVVETIKVN